MDPLTKLTLFIWNFSRRRHSRVELLVYAAVLILCVVIGAVDWAGYWPDILRVERATIPKVSPL
jgi:hypothetical protein